MYDRSANQIAAFAFAFINSLIIIKIIISLPLISFVGLAKSVHVKCSAKSEQKAVENKHDNFIHVLPNNTGKLSFFNACHIGSKAKAVSSLTISLLIPIEQALF